MQQHILVTVAPAAHTLNVMVCTSNKMGFILGRVPFLIRHETRKTITRYRYVEVAKASHRPTELFARRCGSHCTKSTE